jgi:peptidoglycan/LPS O-acetylase OafA/YrhL
MNMILNIQLLRGLAALAVVFYHTAFILYGNVHTDFQGVCIFFVISGFIMTYIIHTRPEHFLLRRVVRIVPLYWIITLIYFFEINLGHFFNIVWQEVSFL